MEHDLSRCIWVTQYFSEFGPLTVEITALRLVLRRGFVYLSSEIRVPLQREEKNVRAPGGGEAASNERPRAAYIGSAARELQVIKIGLMAC